MKKYLFCYFFVFSTITIVNSQPNNNNNYVRIRTNPTRAPANLPVIASYTNSGKYGSYCNLNTYPIQSCSDEFECINNKCNCKSLKHQIYDEKTQQCKSLVGGPCSTTTNNKIVCIDHAICTNKGYYEACECESGYTENSDGKCSAGIGSPCGIQTINTANNESRIFCEASLTCRNGKCDCADELEVYDLIMKKCRGLVGATCTENDGENYCVEKAICKIYNPKLRGRCTCLNVWEEWSDRFCERFDDVTNEIDGGDQRYQTTEDYRQRLRQTVSTSTIRPNSIQRYFRRNQGQRTIPTTTTTITTTNHRHGHHNHNRERTTPAPNTVTPTSSYSGRINNWNRPDALATTATTTTTATTNSRFIPANCPKYDVSDCTYEDCKMTGCSDGKVCCPKPCGGNWCVKPVR